MISLQDRAARLCDGFGRRDWLRIGGLGVLGLSLTDLLAARNVSAAPGAVPRLASGLEGSVFGRAKNVIFLWLQGGPPQHETFDPKPEAPVEIRGPFQAIQTNVPGVHFSELLPRTARRADKLAVIRSLATDDNNHDVSGYWVLTGYPYGPGSARQIKPNDWPYLGSVIKLLKPSEELPALTSVWLPDLMRLNDNVTPAGQTGGFLGSLWDPERFVGDPASETYRIEGLTLPVELPQRRMENRAALLHQLDRHQRQASATGSWDTLSQFALDLVSSGKAKAAFDLSREPDSLRDAYGRHTWGQSCLLARRLIEAGVRLVHVNWPREPGDNAVDNPMWDTHTQNADRLQDVLCPIFDVSYAALLDDLETRGLLSETLVVGIGEFGRTPRINGQGGRDHWGSVFSGTLAGAGIAGGQVFGASDKSGAFPTVDPIRPHDLTATIFHLLGIDHQGMFRDRTNRPQLLTHGAPLYRLLGSGPATSERCPPGGDERFVPPYDATKLVDIDFASRRIFPVTPPSREKGWRGAPLLMAEGGPGIRVLEAGMAIGIWADSAAPLDVAGGARAMLAQEIKSARGGQYTLSFEVSPGGTSAEAFARRFENLTCRLVLFRYATPAKNPVEAQVLASAEFGLKDAVLAKRKTLTLQSFLGATVPGTNFPTGNGLGVGLLLESRTAHTVPAGETAYVTLHQVSLDFNPRPRNENVTE